MRVDNMWVCVNMRECVDNMWMCVRKMVCVWIYSVGGVCKSCSVVTLVLPQQQANVSLCVCVWVCVGVVVCV